MLLVADIGNTSTTIGIFDGEKLVMDWKLASEKNRSEDEFGVLISSFIKHAGFQGRVRDSIISSVSLPLTPKYKAAIEKYLGIPVTVLSHKTQTGILLDVDKPSEVGCDRIANVCAAYNKYKTAAVVIDFGTATTFDIVTEDGRFIGGIIAPGIGISADALSSLTSLLPKVRIEAPQKVIGRNTIDNMLSGLVLGHAAMIDGLLESVEQELGQKVITIATGGYSTMIMQCLKRPFDHLSPHLTLEGLKIIYEMSKQKV